MQVEQVIKYLSMYKLFIKLCIKLFRLHLIFIYYSFKSATQDSLSIYAPSYGFFFFAKAVIRKTAN